jgi:hypothetical protein
MALTVSDSHDFIGHAMRWIQRGFKAEMAWRRHSPRDDRQTLAIADFRRTIQENAD